MLPWTPDHPTTAALAAEVIGAQFPALIDPSAPLTLLGSGWDNDVWTLDLPAGQAAFRFPRRRIAVELLETEARVLPWLAPQLPLPIPLPEWIGAPSPRWPLPFYGYRLLPGQTADRARLSAADRQRVARALIGFLAALHRIPAAAARAAGVPLDTSRSDLEQRVARTLARQDLLPARLAPALRAAALDALTGALARAAPADPAGWACCHGDLYARHLLWQARGADPDSAPGLCGVIDWGDLCLADPAIDLGILWGFCDLAPGAALMDDLAARYPLTPGLLARARVHAIVYALRLLSYADHIADADLYAEAMRSMSALTALPR